MMTPKELREISASAQTEQKNRKKEAEKLAEQKCQERIEQWFKRECAELPSVLEKAAKAGHTNVSVYSWEVGSPVGSTVGWKLADVLTKEGYKVKYQNYEFQGADDCPIEQKYQLIAIW